MNKENIVNCNNLNKSFRSFRKTPGIAGSIKDLFNRQYIDKHAVENFSFNVKKGEILALLGPNGAGKTTLMKMFTGIIVPSSGELSVLGHRPSDRKKDFRKNIALVMGQKSQLWWDIPAMDSFYLLKAYYEISDRDFNSRVEQMSEILQVTNVLNTIVRKLSLGERMKLELMASLLHSPEIIFLDEPTIGLDLLAQENIRNFVKEYAKKNNTTIIITSHYMADIHALCSRLVLIMDGKKSYDGSLNDFEKILGTSKTVSFTFKDNVDVQHSLFKEYDTLWKTYGLEVEINVPENMLSSFSAKVLNQFEISEFSTEKIPIEKVMKKIMNSPELIEGPI